MVIAGLGIIHMGHVKSGLTLLQKFLTLQLSYVQSSALFGLGIICANYIWNEEVISTITNALSSTTDNIIQYGACLSLGLITLGSQDFKYYNQALKVIKENQPESGEAAGYAMGMIMLGIGDTEVYDQETMVKKSVTEELFKIADTTENDSVISGAGMGLALMYYGLEQQAETIITKLLASPKPLLRESAAWITALAYIGKSSSVAIERLISMANLDPNPNVKRTAAIGIGFIMSKDPASIPEKVIDLTRSDHPYVRNGAALALGIACAGTGISEVISILNPLLQDPEDIVKQSARISIAMVLQQTDETQTYKDFKNDINQLFTNPQDDEEIFNACLAYGILIAGGCNTVISCNSLRGENNVLSTIGIALFCSYIYRPTNALMLLLALHPTVIIGLDKDLNIPNWQVSSKEPKRPSPDQPDEHPSFEIYENPLVIPLNQLSKINFSFDNHYSPITNQVHHGIVMLKENEEKKKEN